MENIITEEQKRAMSTMEGKEPFARFRKVTMGRVGGLRLNPIRFTVEEFLLTGDSTDPKADPADFIVELWTEAEYRFFIRKNKRLIEKGSLVRTEKGEIVIDTTNQISDEEIDEVLSKPFLALKHKLDKFTSPVPVRRLLSRAIELDKSTGFVDAIKARLVILDGYEAPPRIPERIIAEL